jgi:hypothetical protein
MIKIRELSTGDIGPLADFLCTQTGMSQSSMRQRLEWLARNPASIADIPFGVAAYQSDQMCGAMVYVPVRFSNGNAIRTCVLSILFYVDSSVRGAGVPIFLAYRMLATRYPLYAATANQSSARLWANFGARAIAGSDFEYVRVCHALPILAELIFRNFSRRQKLGDSADTQLSPPNQMASQMLVPITDPEAALRTIVPSETGSYGLFRDPQMVRWKIYERGQTLYVYRTDHSDCLCLFQCSRRGSRFQIAAVDILEVWGRLDPRDSSNFISCIQRVFSADLIGFRGASPLSKLDALTRRFRRRRFPCPAVWLLDPDNLLENRFEYSALAGE